MSERIRVEVRNEILGDSVFWEGDVSEIERIRNVVALRLARQVASDGKMRRNGMWLVSTVRKDGE